MRLLSEPDSPWLRPSLRILRVEVVNKLGGQGPIVVLAFSNPKGYFLELEVLEVHIMGKLHLLDDGEVALSITVVRH